MAQPLSATSRPIRACEQCRSLKLRCDKGKPLCSRCLSTGRACRYLSQEATSKESPGSVTCRSRSPAESDAASNGSESATSEAGSRSTAFPSAAGHNNQPRMARYSQASPHSLPRPDVAEQQPPGRNHPPAQRRSRAVLSCSRCRKLKVRCDRQNPCGRCRNYGRCCEYRREARGQGPETQALKSKFATTRDLWQAKHCAEGHWYALIEYAKALLRRNGVGDFEDDPFQHPVSADRNSHNYPFVACSDSPLASTETMPQRSMIELLVRQYFNTMGQLFRIVDSSVFELELQQYWRQPEEATPGWMAQLLLMMSLGCDSLNMVDGDFAASHASLPNLFLNQANGLLHQTPFMFRPDLCTIRTLFLMVIAKQTLRKSCLEEDASWCLTGMIKRLAISISLHQDQPSNDSSADLEPERRRKLWTSILYLDLRQAVLSGLPLLMESPGQIARSGSSSPGFYTSEEEAFEEIFHRVLSLAHETLLAARSVDCTYEMAIGIDKEVREILRELKQIPAESGNGGSSSSSDGPVLSWEIIYLENLFRRLLLELHRRFAYQPQAAVYYPVSHWSTLDCAAAMLVLQQSICEDTDSRAGQWLAGIFRPDFSVAGITVSAYLIQGNSLLDSPELPGGYARTTLVEALRSCRDIAARDKDRWECELRKFEFWDQVLSALDKGIV